VSVTLENVTLTGLGSGSVAAFTLTLSHREREEIGATLCQGEREEIGAIVSQRERELAGAMTLPVPEGSAFGSAAFILSVRSADGRPLELAAPVAISVKYTAADREKAGGQAGALKLMAYSGDMRWAGLQASDDDGASTLKASTTKTGLFAIVVELPRPVLTAPASGSVTSDLGPLLSWINPPGTTQHQLQVVPFNGDGPGINLIHNPSTGSGNEGRYQVEAPVFGAGGYVMLPGMSYTWRVRTSSVPNGLGENDAGWSHWDSGSFRTPAPSSGTLRPVTQEVASLLPALAWTDSNSQLFYYEVQLSKDPGFGTNAFLYWELRHGGVTSPPNSYTVPRQYPLEQGTDYYWRVRPRVQGGGEPVA